ncbi:MAG: FxsB family cyclophane-forming radical SAM/SPASM peptide maturase [Candidatus Saccharibacteria bacterium]
MSETIAFKPDFEENLEPELLPIVNQAILKVHSRCNLDCDYCYVYNLGDSSWKEQPPLMSDSTVDVFAERLHEYLEPRHPFGFAITFHGGEPLLAPPEFYDETAYKLRQAAGPRTVLQLGMQTNATLLNSEYLDVFRRNQIKLGISIDGSREANDRHRVNHAGKSSYDKTMAGIELLKSSRYGRLFEGVLAVVDIENDPIETIETLYSTLATKIDLLLPHGNWETPPPGLETDEGRESTPYGKWLATIFDWWFPDEAFTTRIRTFDSIMHTLGGDRSTVESIGGEALGNLVVVETDGSYELVDTLKSTPGRVSKTGLNVFKHSINEANRFMTKRERQLGVLTLAQECQTCPIVEQCGSGYAPHRYSREKRFANRSIYCQDLAYIISHIYGRMHEQSVLSDIRSNLQRNKVEVPYYLPGNPSRQLISMLQEEHQNFSSSGSSA